MSTVHNVAPFRENEEMLRELESRFNGIFPRNVIEFYLQKNQYDYYRTLTELLQMEMNQRRKAEPSYELRPEEAVHLHGQIDVPQSSTERLGYTPSMESRGLNVATVSVVSSHQKPHPHTPDRIQSLYEFGSRKEGMREYGTGKSDPGPLSSRENPPQPPQDYRQQPTHYVPPNEGYRVSNFTPTTPPYNSGKGDPLSLGTPGANPGNYHPMSLAATPTAREPLSMGKRLPSEPDWTDVIQKQREQLQMAKGDHRILLQQLGEAKKGIHEKNSYLGDLKRYNYNKQPSEEDIQLQQQIIQTMKDDITRWKMKPGPAPSQYYHGALWTCRGCGYINSPSQAACEVCWKPR